VKALERERKKSAATANRVAARGHVAAPLVHVSNLLTAFLSVAFALAGR
jgi:hypothetical protein